MRGLSIAEREKKLEAAELKFNTDVFILLNDRFITVNITCFIISPWFIECKYDFTGILWLL